MTLWLAFAAAPLALGCSTAQSTPDDAGSDAGGGPVSACGDTPTEGRCTSKSAFERCVIVSESGEARRTETSCANGEECRLDDRGEANCVLVATCRDGDVECRNEKSLGRCTAGAWVETACPHGCVRAATPACAPGPLPRTLAGRVTYAKRPVTPTRSGFGEPVEAAGTGLLVFLLRGEQILSSASTSLVDGSFSLPAPAALLPEDKVVVTTIHLDGENAAVAVLDPRLPPGTASPYSVQAAPDPVPWTWSFPAATLESSAGRLTIPESDDFGNGVINVFAGTVASYRAALRIMERPAEPIAIWMGPGVQWQCGACQGALENIAVGNRFQAAMFFPTTRETYSDPVIAHEAGHWMMASYGRPAGEGGVHMGMCPSYPGLAWSEGFASWFAAYMTRSAVYYDEQGSFFWFDHEARTSDSGEWAPRPRPSAPDVMPSAAPGLLQLVAEVEITAMLWRISRGAEDPAPILKAMASPRMRTTVLLDGQQSLERRYFAHVTDGYEEGASCVYKGVQRTSTASVTFADELDALVCAGFPVERIRDAVEPTLHFPYDGATPLCR